MRFWVDCFRSGSKTDFNNSMSRITDVAGAVRFSVLIDSVSPAERDEVMKDLLAIVERQKMAERRMILLGSKSMQ